MLGPVILRVEDAFKNFIEDFGDGSEDKCRWGRYTKSQPSTAGAEVLTALTFASGKLGCGKTDIRCSGDSVDPAAVLPYGSHSDTAESFKLHMLHSG